MFFSSSKFVQNDASEGGAIYNAGKLTLKKNSFGLADKSDNHFKNTAIVGGAVYNTGLMTDSSSKFYYNESSDSGGAIYNTGQIGEIESFFEKLVQNIILHKEQGKPLVVLINDVRSINND